MTDAFDLTTSYLHLTDDRRAHVIPVDERFWAEIDERTELHEGRLAMVFPFDTDWATWEIHPAGDEVLVLLDGSMDAVLALPGGDRVVPMRPEQACVVPAGTWHTARNVQPGCRLMTITPGTGTRNAVEPER